MDLKSLMVDSKEVWIDFPGMPGFKVKVANLARKELIKLRVACTSQKFDKKIRGVVDELNEEKFVEEFAKATVKGWKGLTLKYLETLVLIEIGNEDENAELDFTTENAQMLVANSTEFDQWLNEVVFDLDNFRTGSKKPSIKKA